MNTKLRERVRRKCVEMRYENISEEKRNMRLLHRYNSWLIGPEHITANGLPNENPHMAFLFRDENTHRPLSAEIIKKVQKNDTWDTVEFSFDNFPENISVIRPGHYYFHMDEMREILNATTRYTFHFTKNRRKEKSAIIGESDELLFLQANFLVEEDDRRKDEYDSDAKAFDKWYSMQSTQNLVSDLF